MLRKEETIGSYRLIEKVGAGAFGDVWKAERKTLLDSNFFALKFFRPKDDSIDLESIGKELQVWKKLKGLPNIISFFELDKFEEYVYVVSDFADGGSLEKQLKAQASLPESDAIEITLDILNGLQGLHARNIIHRDLKPDNVLIMNRTYCLADFGISRDIKSQSKMTSTAGTLEYMPPEAFDNNRVFPETDIWAVGVILQRMLTGSLPFPQDVQAALMGAIILREPEPLPDSVSNEARQFISRCLRKDPTERFRSAAEAKAVLSRWKDTHAYSVADTVESTESETSNPSISYDPPDSDQEYKVISEIITFLEFFWIAGKLSTEQMNANGIRHGPMVPGGPLDYHFPNAVVSEENWISGQLSSKRLFIDFNDGLMARASIPVDGHSSASWLINTLKRMYHSPQRGTDFNNSYTVVVQTGTTQLNFHDGAIARYQPMPWLNLYLELPDNSYLVIDGSGISNKVSESPQSDIKTEPIINLWNLENEFAANSSHEKEIGNEDKKRKQAAETVLLDANIIRNDSELALHAESVVARTQPEIFDRDVAVTQPIVSKEWVDEPSFDTLDKAARQKRSFALPAILLSAVVVLMLGSVIVLAIVGFNVMPVPAVSNVRSDANKSVSSANSSSAPSQDAAPVPTATDESDAGKETSVRSVEDPKPSRTATPAPIRTPKPTPSTVRTPRKPPAARDCVEWPECQRVMKPCCS